MDKVNRAYKKSLKQILSLPDTVADPAVYIISGALPIEGISRLLKRDLQEDSWQ